MAHLNYFHSRLKMSIPERDLGIFQSLGSYSFRGPQLQSQLGRGRGTVGKCTGAKWSKRPFLVKMTLFRTLFGKWAKTVHFGPFRSANSTLAIAKQSQIAEIARFRCTTLRAQRLKKFKILKFSSEIEKRATHHTPFFCGEFRRSGLKISIDIEIFKRD